MNAGKITAKLRDAVPVCLYADGSEQARYKNIELPDSIKALEIQDFAFDIDATGWISFHLYFDQGTLPEAFPAPRTPRHRRPKEAPAEDYTIATSEGAIIAEIHHAQLTDPAQPEDFTARFDVPGKQRSKLAQAIGKILESEAKYLGAPSFAYRIAALILDREGTLHSPAALDDLLPLLAEYGFCSAE